MGPEIDPSGSAPVSFEVFVMAEKLCAVLKTIGGTRCDNAAMEGDADGLCKQHRAQITNFGARAWAVYAGFASHFKHVAGDDAPVPQASKAAAIRYGLRKADAEVPKEKAVKAAPAKASKKSGKLAKATAAKATMDSKHKERLAKLAAPTEKSEQAVAQAAPVAEAPVAPEIKVSASDVPVIPVVVG